MQAAVFPFRFRRNRLVTVDIDEDRYVAQKVASSASTYIGELPLMPQFGVRDPEFGTFDVGSIVYNCAIFFPEVNITNVFSEQDDNGRLKIEIEFERKVEGTNYGIS